MHVGPNEERSKDIDACLPVSVLHIDVSVLCIGGMCVLPRSRKV